MLTDRRLARIAITSALIGLLGSCQRAPSEKAETLAAVELQTVSVRPVGRETLTTTLTLTAEFVPYQEVDVMAKISGYVKQINVDTGDAVRQGQVLAVLESPEMRDDLTRAGASIQRYRADLQRAGDEVKRAESNYTMTHLTFTRLENVMKSQPGLVAQQEVDDAQGKDLSAQAQLASAKSALSVAEEQIKVSQAEQTRSQTMLDYTKVVAPFDGVVTKRYADNGTMIQAGTSSRSQVTPVVRVSQIHLLRLTLPIPESAAGMVKPGREVEVRVPSLGINRTARVSRISDKVDTTTRTMLAEVDVANADRKLIPGMYAEVTLKVGSSSGALVVPTQSLKTLADGKRQVAIVDANGVVALRTVKTGLETATQVEILDGVETGEQVVTGSHSQLLNGTKVKAGLEGAK